jgi:hypothetical protein
MKFPNVEPEAVNEYDESIRIFAQGFPWLFPGGIGDWADVPITEDLTIEQWARFLLFYEDGRFARDKMWCFYALNFIQRRQNMKSGSFFVKTFCGSDSPQTLQQLQDMISEGNTSWIDKICYFGNNLKGSSLYWRQRREEIHSWINFHVQKGNGAPTAFMTLSCAEHYWPDVECLLNKRLDFETRRIKNEALSTLINEYTIVIQEYFQLRVGNWLDTVGKHVFKIKHFWLRFEFAPGRGQIHAHCLLIMDNMEVQKEAYKAMQHAIETDIDCDLEHHRAEVLQSWVEQDFAMTTSLPDNFQPSIPSNVSPDQHPASKKLSQVKDLESDLSNLLMTVQNHVCTGYCMRKRKIW